MILLRFSRRLISMLIHSSTTSREYHITISRRISLENGENLAKVNHLIEEVLLDSQEEMMIGIKEAQEIKTIDHHIQIGFKIRGTMATKHLRQATSAIKGMVINLGPMMTEVDRGTMRIINHT